MKKAFILLLAIFICVFLTTPVVFASEIDPTEEITNPTESTEEDTTDREHGGGGSSMDGTEETKPTFLEWLTDKFIFFLNMDGIDVESTAKLVELITSIGDVVSGITSKFTGNIMEPVLDFIERISSAAVELIAPIWDFPIIKDLLILTVALCIIGGLFGLFIR